MITQLKSTDVLGKALTTFGIKSQVDKYLEETNELMRAFYLSDYKNIAEEIADVDIMLRQMHMCFNLTEPVIDRSKLKGLVTCSRSFKEHKDDYIDFIYQTYRIFNQDVIDRELLKEKLSAISYVVTAIMCYLDLEGSVEKCFNYKIKRLESRIGAYKHLVGTGK